MKVPIRRPPEQTNLAIRFLVERLTKGSKHESIGVEKLVYGVEDLDQCRGSGGTSVCR